MVALIENSGFRRLACRAAIRGVYDVYYRKTRIRSLQTRSPSPDSEERNSENN